MPPKAKRNKLMRWGSPDVSLRADTETVVTLEAQKLRVYSVYTHLPAQVARKAQSVKTPHGSQAMEYDEEAMDTDEGLHPHDVASFQDKNPANITVNIKAKRNENSVSFSPRYLPFMILTICRTSR
jgi:hypothetical protein